VLRAELSLSRNGFDLDLEVAVEPGACLALAGPSGCGKTTTLRAVAGLVAPQRGRVACGDRLWLDTARGINVSPERRGCGYVFQDYALFGHQRAWQNVAYGLRHLPRRERRHRALELLERFGLADRAEARPSALSGGERQRVALARALAPRPAALLLDEPLSALDARSCAEATRVLAEILADARVPTIFVTHDFQEAALFGDKVAVLAAGRMVQRGPAEELAASPASAFVADFSGAVVLIGTARPDPGAGAVVQLEGGGRVVSTARATGRVAASVFPWEISLEPPDAPPLGSIRNHIPGTVRSITRFGGRVRVGLDACQPLTAEITEGALRELGLRRGTRVIASWKAAATRLSAL